MRNAIGDNLDRQSLCITDGLLASRAIGHHAGQFQSLGDPAAIVLAIKLDRKVPNPV
jgi:hypothetical protein